MTAGRIDAHAHYIAPAYREALTSNGTEKIGGIPVPPWTPELAIGFMDAHGIGRQVLSVSDPGVDFLPPDQAEQLAATCNDYLAEVIAEHPDRFSGLAVVSGASASTASREAVRCLEELGFAGVGLLSSYGGRYLGDPGFDPLLEELDARGSWVMVHPTAVSENDKPDLPIPDFMAEYPFDTTRAFLHLLIYNVFERFPNIRWHFSHGGGAIPMLAARMDAAATHAKLIAPVLGLPERATELGPHSARNALRKSYYDTGLIATHGSLEAVNGITGTDRILFGTDWPFAGLMYPLEGDPQPVLVEIYSESQQTEINRDNAASLLSITEK